MAAVPLAAPLAAPLVPYMYPDHATLSAAVASYPVPNWTELQILSEPDPVLRRQHYLDHHKYTQRLLQCCMQADPAIPDVDIRSSHGRLRSARPFTLSQVPSSPTSWTGAACCAFSRSNHWGCNQHSQTSSFRWSTSSLPA